MTRHVTLISVAVVVGAAAVSLNAEEETRKSEIATFETVQQNKDYRVSLLGVTKGIAFVDSQGLIDGGGRPPGKNAVPWMRVATVVEKLTNNDETWGFAAETADGRELTGKLRIESSGRVFTSRTRGIAEMDFNFPSLRAATFPTGLPKGVDAKNAKAYVFTLSGKFQAVETMLLRFSFGNENNRRELVFKDVPLP